MFQNIGATEWTIIVIVLLVLFGSKKIPEFFKGVGEAVREFKKASSEESKEED